MGSLLKYLIIALFLVLGISWALTVTKSCNTTNPIDSTIGQMGITDEATNPVEENDSELEDLYEVDETDVEDGNADSPSEANNEENLYASAADGGADETDDTATPSTEDTDNALSDEATNPDDGTNSSSNSGSTSRISGGSTFGKYLVVTGSYLSEANAKTMAKKLRRMGYEGAEVVSFDLSQYFSVTAGRYNDLGEARSIAKALKSKVGEAYVHKMRGKKVDGR